MLRNFPRSFSAFIPVGQKKSHKFPAKFPCEESKKITDELLQERRENQKKQERKIEDTFRALKRLGKGGFFFFFAQGCGHAARKG